MKYSISLALVLAGVWTLWSGHYGALLLTLGGVSCAGVLVIALNMKIVDREGAPIELVLRALRYVPWLVWQIVKANLDVAGRILRPRMPISPTVIKVRAGQRHDIGRAIYANSITLTPGTVSIDTQGDEITVHALSTDSADELLTGEMDRQVTRFEGGA